MSSGAAALTLGLLASLCVAQELPEHIVIVQPRAVADAPPCPSEPRRVATAAADAPIPSPAPSNPALAEPTPMPEFKPGPGWPTPSATRPIRIAIWGDSHMASGAFRTALATEFESRGLTVQASIIPVNLTQPGIYLPIRAACAPPSDWALHSSYRSAEPLDVGLGLTALTSTRRGSRLWLDLRDASGTRRYRELRIRYSPSDSPVHLTIGADDSPARPITLAPRRAGGAALEEIVVRASTPLALLTVRVADGILRVQGLMPASPGGPADVTLDSFGLPSATFRGWSNAMPATLRAALTGSGYDIALFAYGTNEGAAPDFDPVRYEADLRRSLRAVRDLLPAVACLMVGPPDRGVAPSLALRATGDDPYFYARRHAAIAGIQRRVAPEYGCASWDWQWALGGPGSSYGMARASPALVQRDLTHMTSAGYRRAAHELARFLGWTSAAAP